MADEQRVLGQKAQYNAGFDSLPSLCTRPCIRHTLLYSVWAITMGRCRPTALPFAWLLLYLCFYRSSRVPFKDVN